MHGGGGGPAPHPPLARQVQVHAPEPRERVDGGDGGVAEPARRGIAKRMQQVGGRTTLRVERDAAGRLIALTQNNWRVTFTYRSDGDGEEKASSVRRVDLKDGPNEIRFVIDTWREVPQS